MNAVDIMKYGQLTVLGAVEGLPEADWEAPGVCGVWSVNDIVAHLASYEQVLVEILSVALGESRPTPYLDEFRDPAGGFNDNQVALRRDATVAATLAEFNEAHARSMELIVQIPLEERRRVGALPWYGAEYDLEDAIVYMVYGHKREHSAQIALFRDRLVSPT